MALQEPAEDTETDKIGRPCKYDSHVKPYLDKVYEWLKDGYTDYSISNQLGIDQDTWIKYKKEYPILSELYARARTQRNCLVMNSMYSKANGLKASVNKVKVLNSGDIIEYTEETYIPPDVNAADLYLRNNSDDYKSARADAGGVTLIQNNYQLPQLQQQLLDIDAELKRLDIIDTTSTDI